jgi:hypothetical protein
MAQMKIELIHFQIKDRKLRDKKNILIKLNKILKDNYCTLKNLRNNKRIL